MARPTLKNKNPIIEAGNRLNDEDEALLDAELSDEDSEDGQDYDPADVDVDTMLEAVEKLTPAARRQLDATRKRGQSPHKQTSVHQGRNRQERREPNARERASEWRPADTLFAPAPKPGMENRWIRIRLGEKDDPRNFQKKYREGWTPIKLSDCSEDLEPPSMSFGRHGDVVAVSDLVLCERPLAIGLSRKKHFRQRLERQLRSADRRHVNKVQRDDHVIRGGARIEKPTVGRGTRNRTPVQDDGE
jgi:hypothetical protein